MKRLLSFCLSVVLGCSILVSTVPTASAAETIIENTTYNVSVSYYSYVEYRFVAPATGNYVISSSGSTDSLVKFYDGSGNFLNSNDNASDTNKNFSLNCYMAANYTYYFRVYNNSYRSETFSFRLQTANFTGQSGYIRANITSAGESVRYNFIPNQTGVYRFYSLDEYNDTRVHLYDKNNTHLDWDDDSGEYNNFAISYYMLAGETYTISPSFYDSYTTGTFEVYFEKLSTHSISFENSANYYVNDDPKAGVYNVIAYYPTYCEDTFQRVIPRNEYSAEIDTSQPIAETRLTVTYDGKSSYTYVKVIKPTIHVVKDGSPLYDLYDRCLLSQVDTTLTAVTNPGATDVSWASSDTDIVTVKKVDNKTAVVSVKKPSFNDVFVTAKYIYNDIEYSCTFTVMIGFTLEDIKVVKNTTKYSYGSSFKRETLELTYKSIVDNSIFYHTTKSTDPLPTTKTTPGTYTRTVDFSGKLVSYPYIVTCAKPTISSVSTTSSSKLTVKWAKAGGAKGYYVYVATSENGTYTRVGSTTDTSFVCTELSPNKKYYVKVRAYYSKSDSTYNSTSSAAVAGKTKLKTPKISSVKASSTSKQKISWSGVSGAAGYHVYRATSKTGTYKKIGSTSKTSFTSSGLTANKVYYYKVKAYYSKSGSKYDSASSSAASGRTKISTPTNVKASAGKKKVTVSWSKVSGASKYGIYRATSKTGTYKRIATTKSTSYVNSGLTSKKAYYYKIIAYSSTSGSHSAYSSIVGARAK